MNSCKDITALLSARHERPLKWYEGAAVRLHLTLCGPCRRYQCQLHLIHKAAADFYPNRKKTDHDEPL